MLISHFGELHFHPTLSSGQTWMTANNGIVPLEPASSSRCYKTASGLISPCHPTWYPLAPWDGRFPPRRDSLWCPSFEWSEISISEHPGMISNPDTNIKYASQSPKNSLYQPFGKYLPTYNREYSVHLHGSIFRPGTLNYQNRPGTAMGILPLRWNNIPKPALCYQGLLNPHAGPQFWHIIKFGLCWSNRSSKENSKDIFSLGLLLGV